ncbi:hypothetical protein ACHAWO_008193 [Cyclotella atomus]|uniref:Uncharacterized protein n=1 Tax=Cyclotella atomus TaxID=382360 RepID=A0ABD3NBM1_9STRA
MMAIQVIKDHCLSNYYLIQRDKLNGKGAISVKVVMTGVFKRLHPSMPRDTGDGQSQDEFSTIDE